MRLKVIEGKDKGKARDGGPGGERGQEGWRDVRDRERQRAYEPGQKTTSTLEWRERWAVIKDDAVHLYRQRGVSLSGYLFYLLIFLPIGAFEASTSFREIHSVGVLCIGVFLVIIF